MMRDTQTSTIPATAHFLWLGDRFPWVNLLALRSAATRGGFDRLVLHHDGAVGAGWPFRQLAEIPGLELRPFDARALWSHCGFYASALAAVWERLSSAAMRADLIRLAVLYSEGGVYLDMDTITLRSLADLRADTAAFCGEERIVYPLAVRRSWNPIIRLAALLRNGVRGALSRLPEGWAAFRALEAHFPRAANNAVLGSVAKGKFVTLALEDLVGLAPRAQTRPFGIGPHLLQGIVSELEPPDLRVHGPGVFYPLGPEISRHWFHLRAGSEQRLQRVLLPETRVVHWYSSVAPTGRLASRIDDSYVRLHAGRQLFSALALPFADASAA
jgi:hypothetical protein